jgi:hypothetical protein
LCLFAAFSIQLEVELQAKLKLSRITGGEELAKLADSSEIRDAVKSRVCRQPIRNGLEDVVEYCLVEDVVELRTKLEFVPLAEVEVLRQIHIREELARKAER